MTTRFPFVAIVGLALAKRSLIYHTLDPRLGGILLQGHRGCAKSTLARAFTDLLQTSSQDTVPFVEVPLGTTEDRLLGSVNAGNLVEQGQWQLQQGLMAQADGGVLYIDEVNLLPDHLTDSLLDAAVSGKQQVERDGLSANLKTRFILVGSMNPEEGELRPQLLDRFGLSVDVTSPTNIDDRVSIIERRDEFEQNKKQFVKRWASEDAKIKIRILSARKKLTAIKSDKKILRDCADLCVSLGTDGLRGELSLIRASRALAAYEGAKSVERMHLKEISILALAHRLRRDPLDEAGSLTRVKRAVADLIE